MSEDVTVSQFVTKQLIIKEDSKDRFFEGILSVEIKDRQGEITDIDELYKALPVWMERGGAMSDTHSNRIVGRGINFERVTLTTKNNEELPAIKIMGKIHSNTALDDFIWKQIVDGKYRGLSFGGATKANRTPVIQSDGSMAYALKDLEIYEVAVCEDPAVAFALITDVNPRAKSNINKAFHIERPGEKLKIKCEGTKCYINADVVKADIGTPINEDEVPKKTETFIGSAGEKEEKAIYGQAAEDFPPTKIEKPEDKTKPLPTQWGSMEFSACEAHAKKDPKIKNPGGYCGSIQSAVEKDTKVHADKKEYASTESCISGEGNKDNIKDAEAYCGSRHNDEHGINPNSPKHKGAEMAAATAGHTGHGNDCKEGASCSDKPDLSEAGIKEVTGSEVDGDRNYFKKYCGCTLILKDIVGTGTENPRGLGAYNTAVNGTGGSKDITSRVTDPEDEKKKDGIVTPENLGDPDKLGKIKDPAAKSKCEFEKTVRKYWEENKTLDNNSALHTAIKDFVDNYKEETFESDSFIIKAYLDRGEEEWVAELTKYSTSPEGIAQYGANIEVSPEGNLVNESGDTIFINPFI